MTDYSELVRRLRDNSASGDLSAAYMREAADAIEKLSAEVKRLNGYILAFHTDIVVPLRQELDEAIAARETYAMTAREDVIQKAKALDAMEEWLRENRGCRAQAYSLARSDEVSFRLDMVAQTAHRAPTLAAAIMDALRRAGE